MKKCSPVSGADQELDRARVHVLRGPGQPQGVVQDPGAQGVVETGGRRDFDHLLVAQLDRAVPLVEVDGVAGSVGEDLHLDVARPLDHLLDEQRAVAERGLRLAAAALEGFGHRRNRRTPGACRGRRRPPPPSASPDSRALRPHSAASSAEPTGRGCPARPASRARRPPTGPASCRRRAPAPPRPVRRRPGPRPKWLRRTRRSRTGTRSRDGRNRSRSRAPPRRGRRCRDRPTGSAGAPPPIGRASVTSACAGTAHRRARARRRSQCPGRPRPGRCGWRSRRDWRSALGSAALDLYLLRRGPPSALGGREGSCRDAKRGRPAGASQNNHPRTGDRGATGPGGGATGHRDRAGDESGRRLNPDATVRAPGWGYLLLANAPAARGRKEHRESD